MCENDDDNTDSTIHDDNSSQKDEDSSSEISSMSTRSQKKLIVKIEKKNQTNLCLKTGLHTKIVKRTWVWRKKLLIIALLCTAKKSLSVWLRSASNILSRIMAYVYIAKIFVPMY